LFCGWSGGEKKYNRNRTLAPDAQRTTHSTMTNTTETPPGMDTIWKIASPADLEAWKAAGAIVGQGLVFFTFFFS
jgi:hypothetical protein